MSHIAVTLLDQGNAAALLMVAPDVFDHSVDPRWAAEFLDDPRHHLAMALADGQVVGMASAVHYVHPDKPPELWINEVAVTPAHQRAGLGRRLLQALFARGKELGCRSAWVLTDGGNAAAFALYVGAGGQEEVPRPVMFEFTL